MDIERIVQETFHNYRMSAVMVLMRTATTKDVLGVGSGFVIGRGNTSYLVITCRHCVVSENVNDVTLSIRVAGKTTEYEAEKLHDDNDADIAILKVKGVPEECPVLEFGNSKDIPLNTSVVQLGYVFESKARLNLNPAVAPGSIVALRQQGSHDENKLAYTAAAMHGTSGSALLMDSKVIGVVSECSLSDQIVFAVASDTIDSTMRDWLETAREVSCWLETAREDGSVDLLKDGSIDLLHDGTTIEQMIDIFADDRYILKDLIGIGTDEI